MEETDVGRVLAAAAPETVPVIGDLPGRARALGKRRRRRRAAVAGGGAGVAAAFGAALAVGAFGTFGAGGRPAGVPLSPGATSATSTDRGTWTPTSSPDAASSMHGGEMDVSDDSLLPALRAALPAKHRDRPTPGPASVNHSAFGASFVWGPKADGAWLSLQVQVSTPQSGDPCAAATVHCTTGTGTLQGNPVTWTYNTDGTHAETFLIWSAKFSYGLDYTGPMTGPGSIDFAELRDIGLNDGVAAALLSAFHAAPGN